MKNPCLKCWAVRAGCGVSLLVVAACGATPTPAPGGAAVPATGAATTGTAATSSSGPIFTDVAAATGLDFVHRNGMTDQRYFVEIQGAGGALFDYDNDGDLDVYLPQGHLLGPVPAMTAAAGQENVKPGGQLFRNDLTKGPDGKPVLHFTDVTAASGIEARGYGMSAATGDYDNDGDVDLYLGNWGPNQLWRNNGDGSFTDVTAAAGVDDPRWSSGASFVDYDKDGWLDLVVVNYDRYSVEGDHECHSAVAGRRDYCGPKAYPYEPPSLFHNRGDGSFEDVTGRAGLTATYGPALGVVATDFNGDGWPDILVANDGEANTLWINQGGQRFTEEGMARGLAVNRQGVPEANMGVVASDLDGDCDEDVFITHLTNEMNTLWANDGQGQFEDATPRSGLGFVSVPMTGFGVADLDYDNDGNLDLYATNGAVVIIPEQAAAGDPLPLKQPDQLFHGQGDGRFEDVSAEAGPTFQQLVVGRGASGGDIDNDGDTDILATQNNGPVRLLLNEVGQDAHWLGLRLTDESGQRDLLGTQAVLTRADGHTACRRVRVDGSYASAQDPRLVFGLGASEGPADLKVTWPDGKVEVFKGLAAGQYHALKRGSGTPGS